jgi:hypothetical protein
MQLDPKISVILNIVYQVLTGITATTLSTLGVADATHVAVIAETIAGVLNIVMHAYSSPMAGPAVADPKV